MTPTSFRERLGLQPDRHFYPVLHEDLHHARVRRFRTGGGEHDVLGTGLYILAWIVIWNFLFRSFLAHHADQPAAQGLSTLI